MSLNRKEEINIGQKVWFMGWALEKGPIEGTVVEGPVAYRTLFYKVDISPYKTNTTEQSVILMARDQFAASRNEMHDRLEALLLEEEGMLNVKLKQIRTIRRQWLSDSYCEIRVKVRSLLGAVGLPPDSIPIQTYSSLLAKAIQDKLEGAFDKGGATNEAVDKAISKSITQLVLYLGGAHPTDPPIPLCISSYIQGERHEVKVDLHPLLKEIRAAKDSPMGAVREVESALKACLPQSRVLTNEWIECESFFCLPFRINQ